MAYIKTMAHPTGGSSLGRNRPASTRSGRKSRLQRLAQSAANRVVLMIALLICGGAFPPTSNAQMTMLQTRGTNIVGENGNVVPLRGVNLGGWFVMEAWMCPLDSGGLQDTYSVIKELDTRFGVATEQSLIAGYQNSWITAADLNNIKSAGFNVIRVPVWWGQFFPLGNVSNSGWRSDAFTELDWLVNAASNLGIYVIIDMHGVVGGQSTSQDTGQANANQFWTNSEDQSVTAFMWTQIATHYKGNPTIAGYDLINEPTGAPSTQAVWTAYNTLYSTVRAADPDHIIFLEGAFGNWDWTMLPPPSQYGWTNVVYEMHEYQYSASNAGQVEAGSDNQISDFKNHLSWDVPGYIGEFNDMGFGAAAWQYSLNDYNGAGLSWSMWAYKAAHGVVPDGWGFYDPASMPPTPNISSDSSGTIQSDWAQWGTASAFVLNPGISITGGENSASSSSSSSGGSGSSGSSTSSGGGSSSGGSSTSSSSSSSGGSSSGSALSGLLSGLLGWLF